MYLLLGYMRITPKHGTEFHANSAHFYYFSETTMGSLVEITVRIWVRFISDQFMFTLPILRSSEMNFTGLIMIFMV